MLCFRFVGFIIQKCIKIILKDLEGHTALLVGWHSCPEKYLDPSQQILGIYTIQLSRPVGWHSYPVALIDCRETYLDSQKY